MYSAALTQKSLVLLILWRTATFFSYLLAPCQVIDEKSAEVLRKPSFEPFVRS
jgi:hypothetical protein